MKISVGSVSSHIDTLRLMAKLARKYRYDSAVSHWMGRTSRDLYSYLRSIYRRERGEILQRPDVTDRLRRADCDDQAIYLAAALLRSGVPESRITFALAGRRRIGHVFVIYTRPDGREVWLDALPDRYYDQRYPYPILKRIRLSEL